MIQDLLLPITRTAGDSSAMSAAIALASAYDAHLSVVQPVNLPWPWGMTPDVVLSDMYAENRAEVDRQATLLRTRLEKETISWEVRLDEPLLVDLPSRMAFQARYVDMSVMTAPKQGADGSAVTRTLFSALLFESGRPVLVVPTHHPVEVPLRHVVIAWKPTREATRALHDSLTLLEGATSIDVVMVDPVVGDMDHGADPGVDIATHLSRHGLRVNVVSIPRAGGTVATTLLRHAAESNAQLLIAGGYGHSRLREWALGGTTRELLHALHLPVLFSH